MGIIMLIVVIYGYKVLPQSSIIDRFRWGETKQNITVPGASSWGFIDLHDIWDICDGCICVMCIYIYMYIMAYAYHMCIHIYIYIIIYIYIYT